MTREEALHRVEGYLHADGYSDTKEIIKALKQEPVEPVIESAYKTGYEMGKSITMIESVR
jgi:hypothetical protein